ncbi:MAG: ClpXP protease specificity-enhancing factor [Gallionella sp.]
MSELSTRPYLIRAIHEWCVDGGYTPYLAVRVNEATEVPRAYVKDGEIILNLNPNAVRNLDLGNDVISCSSRFNGVVHQLFVPVEAVIGIFAKETGQGLVFQAEDAPPPPSADAPSKPSPSRPKLKIVK